MKPHCQVNFLTRNAQWNRALEHANVTTFIIDQYTCKWNTAADQASSFPAQSFSVFRSLERVVTILLVASRYSWSDYRQLIPFCFSRCQLPIRFSPFAGLIWSLSLKACPRGDVYSFRYYLTCLVEFFKLLRVRSKLKSRPQRSDGGGRMCGGSQTDLICSVIDRLVDSWATVASSSLSMIQNKPTKQWGYWPGR